MSDRKYEKVREVEVKKGEVMVISEKTITENGYFQGKKVGPLVSLDAFKGRTVRFIDKELVPR